MMIGLHRSTHYGARRIGLVLALIGWISCTALPVCFRTGQGSALARSRK